MKKNIQLNPLVYTGKNPELWAIANEVVDPEIPVLTVVDLGIVRDIEKEGDSITVSITPTYSGCPAMDMIATDIKKIFQQKGFADVTVKTILSPAWTTDWMSDDAKERLRQFGISPPEHTTADKNALLGKSKTVKCPRCGSMHTEMISNFGSTACKALWKCLDCKEPFDYFKCI
ncbi:MAG TPA: 1,2-phenylacetyl-CoA epoxidase subunit PaaD [Bacteroidia bacterium]|nr:1,2-phenylacetyl-CoA epoxidase subunit PaaD [Bacteroidia bacterium]